MDHPKIFVAIRLRELDTALANDPETLLAHTKLREEVKHYISSMTLAVGGNVLGEHEGDVIVDLPLESAEVIRDMHSRIEDELYMATTIGVGDDLREAKLALDWAIQNRPGSIKVMEPDIADAKLESSKDDKYDYFGPDDMVMDTEGRAVNIKKSENDKTQDWADDKEHVSEDAKQKAVKIVQMLQQKRDYLMALQQSNPELYNGVIGLVQSISTMMQSAKEADAKKHSKLMTKIVNHLDQAESDVLDGDTAKVLEALVEAEKEHKEELEFRNKAAAGRSIAKRKMAEERADKSAKKHGLDKNFLTHLLR